MSPRSSSRTTLIALLALDSLSPVSMSTICLSSLTSTPMLTPPGMTQARSASGIRIPNLFPPAGPGLLSGGHYTGAPGGNVVDRQPFTAVRHVVEVGQFDRPGIERSLSVADRMRDLPRAASPLAGFTLATIFYEPSTRTRLSFETAMLKLGGNVISTENAREFSSAIKGESVEDTVRIVGGYADAIVIRHYEQGSAHRAAMVAAVPILNAGDGPGEHPTQALLDLYTIGHELGRIDALKVALVGDLKYGRPARSLALLLRETTGAELIFVSPPGTPMGDDIRAELAASGVRYRDESNL